MELTHEVEDKLRGTLERLCREHEVPQLKLCLDTEHIYRSRSSESNSFNHSLVAGSYYPKVREIIIYMRLMRDLGWTNFHLYHEFKHSLQHNELGTRLFTEMVKENGEGYETLQEEADIFALEEQVRNPTNLK